MQASIPNCNEYLSISYEDETCIEMYNIMCESYGSFFLTVGISVWKN